MKQPITLWILECESIVHPITFLHFLYPLSISTPIHSRATHHLHTLTIHFHTHRLRITPHSHESFLSPSTPLSITPNPSILHSLHLHYTIRPQHSSQGRRISKRISPLLSSHSIYNQSRPTHFSLASTHSTLSLFSFAFRLLHPSTIPHSTPYPVNDSCSKHTLFLPFSCIFEFEYSFSLLIGTLLPQSREALKDYLTTRIPCGFQLLFTCLTIP